MLGVNPFSQCLYFANKILRIYYRAGGMAQQVFATQVRQPELTPGKGGKKELTPQLF